METKDNQEKNKQSVTEINKPAGGAMGGQTGSQANAQESRSGQTAGSAAQTSRYEDAGQKSGRESNADWSDVKERGAEMADKAKQTVTDAYKRTSQSLNEGYGQAVDYGREHPGQTALICFGVGVSVGLWLANTASSRSRASRIVPPVMTALSDIAVQLFR